MASNILLQKRIAYNAASIAFNNNDSDLLILSTNIIKKDLNSNHYVESAIAMHTLAQIANDSLARDLFPDIQVLITHSNPYMRKRAILVSYRLFLKYPEALRSCFLKLKDRLSDEDQSVVSTAVCVFCELSRKNPKSYLPLAPQLYHLLTTAKHNWMLIKIVKIFAYLAPFEPRLQKKLISPLHSLIKNTRATSLLYECIQTVIDGKLISLNESTEIKNLINLCMEKLRLFIESEDQNLKYLGLFCMNKMLKTRPEAVTE